MKKFFLFSACIAFSFALLSCGGPKKPTITVKMITEASGINDRSYNAAAWDGILSFYGDERGEEEGFGELYDVTPCREMSYAVSLLQQTANESPDLIIVVSFALENALRTVSPMYPNQKFLSIDSSFIDSPNVLNFLFASEEGSFLVGCAAALQSIAENVQNPKFGFIGGVNSDIITDFEAGFIQGVRSIISDAVIYEYYAGDWAKPELAAAVAKKWYTEEGVYAIYSAAGATGNGTIAQAVAQRKMGKNVWAIGVDRDQYDEGYYGVGKSAVLTSMIKRVDTAVKYGLMQVQNNTFKPGTVVLGLKESGVGYTSTNADLNAEVQKQLTGIMASIVTGYITVSGLRNDPERVHSICETVKK